MITFTQIIDEAKAHLQTVTTERSLYRSVCKSSRETLKSVFSEADLFQPPSPSSYQQPMSHEMTVHYSFDMAQQVQNHAVCTSIKFFVTTGSLPQ